MCVRVLHTNRHCRHGSWLRLDSAWQTRVRVLHAIADSLEANEGAILAANARDVEAAEKRRIDAVLLQRLRLAPGKLRTLARGIRAIAGAEEPLHKVFLLCVCACLTAFTALGS